MDPTAGPRPLHRGLPIALGDTSDQMFCSVVLFKKLLYLTLTLFMARVFADHHDNTVATNHLALVTHLLNARIDLHRALSWFGWLSG